MGIWLQSIGAVVRNSLRMEDHHFVHDLSDREAIDLFQKHVELIEFETTSYCNRTCSFCPNSFIDRISEKLIMPEKTWRVILDGLREVSYQGSVVWSRYSEPLSETRIVERIQEVRRAAPESRICINSNGDYLNADYLARLEDAGLDRLFVDIYFPDAETYDYQMAADYHDKFLSRIKRSAVLLAKTPELAYKISSPKTEIVAHVRNVAGLKDMSDRGGLIQIARQTNRDAPCYAPYKHLVIDWDGSVVICCQLRSDSPSHRGGVIGKIGSEMRLTDAYVRLAGWRRSLRTFGPKKGPCGNCNVSEYVSTRLTRSLSRRFIKTQSPFRAVVKAALQPALRRKRRF